MTQKPAKESNYDGGLECLKSGFIKVPCVVAPQSHVHLITPLQKKPRELSLKRAKHRINLVKLWTQPCVLKCKLPLVLHCFPSNQNLFKRLNSFDASQNILMKTWITHVNIAWIFNCKKGKCIGLAKNARVCAQL